jgi:photosystem II stability/assembly factor-like uncharacterized protein
MKKFLSLLTLVLFAMGASFAEPVDVKTAQKVAENQYRNYAPATITDFSVKDVFTTEHKGIQTYYTFVFNAGGFVIVAADDAVTPVLGYSHEGEVRRNELNPNAAFWLNQYNENIVDIVSKKLSNTETRQEWNTILENNFPKNEKAVAPLFNITWGQGTGYNTYCPTGTPVGCVATAMAMIMRHYQYPTSGAGWHKYTHPTYGQQEAFFFSTTYNYAAMPTNTGSTATATLSYHLGVAVDMNYGPSGSGAQSSDVGPVMANYFKYDQGIQYQQKANFSNTDWINLLKSELDNARPIYYSGSSAASGGHAFVCIGYNDNSQFYFNWGWDGYLNGYFTMGSLNPGGNNFNDGNAAVINIKPALEGEDEMLWVQKYTGFPQESTYPGYISAVNESVAWAIGRDGSGGGANYRVFSVTVDGGANWTSGQATYGTAFAQVFGIDANTAYIASYGTGTGNKIIKTTNRGLTWEPILSGAGAASFFNVIHFFDENNGYVQGDPESGYYELYTTSDAGANWVRVPSANIPAPASASEYGIVGHYTAIGNITWYTTNNGYVYKSTNRGLNWTKYQIFSTTSTDCNIRISFSDDAMTGLALAFVGSGTYRKFKTVDGGETWTELLSAPLNFYNSDISAVPGVNNMFVSVGADYQGNKMGVSYTLDAGATWEDYAQYYKGTQLVSVAMVSETKGYAGAFQGTYSGGMWILGGTSNMAANFSVNLVKACVEQEVTYTNTSFGQFTEIEWNFGEGATPATANTVGPHAVTYSTSGMKTVSVTISDGNTTMTETKTNLVEIVGLPEADFTYIVNEGFPRLVDFTAASSVGVISGARYIWNMGNGVTLTRTTPTLQYIYSAQGVYEVTLTIENIIGGCSDVIVKTVDNTLSIDENGLSELAIYPNPANEKLTVANVNGAQIEIYSIDGRLAFKAQADSDVFEINVGKFKGGIYTIKVINVNNTVTKTIAIQ